MAFTGNYEIYLLCRYHLLNKGFEVCNAIHIGDDKYEFSEPMFLKNKKGIHNTHTILAWIEDGEVTYDARVTGFCANDDF